MMKKCFTAFFCMAIGLMSTLSAQQKNISGTISDATGPIPGVVVLNKSNQLGTATDFDGFYQIKANKGDVLVFSYVGLKTQEIKVGDNDVINVKLEEDTAALDEVVVVAYGTQTKESIVGAVAVVDEEILENQQLTNVTTAIQGSVPGVNIIASGGQPGSSPTIRIRGTGSINAAASPLIVLDGVPYNGDLASISPEQIKSMNVLKDASSTSLYGSRGANGVILINTKKGKIGDTKVSIKSTVGFANRAVALHELASTDDYMRYTYESFENMYKFYGYPSTQAKFFASEDVIPALGYNPYYSDKPIDEYGNLVSTEKKWDTNWEDHLFNQSAFRQEHSVSISGGSENNTYFLSASHLDQEGQIKTSDFVRTALRLNIDSQTKSWLKTGLNLSYTTQSQNFPVQSGTNFESPVQWLYAVPSLYPLYARDENGDLLLDENGQKYYDYSTGTDQSINGNRPQFQFENAVGALYNYEYNYKTHYFAANGYAQLLLKDNLSFKSQVSYEKYAEDNFGYDHYKYGAAASVNGRITQQRSFTTSKNITNVLNYFKRFNDLHKINVDVIHEAFAKESSDLGGSAIGFLPGIKVMSGAVEAEDIGSSVGNQTLQSVLGRVSYNFDSKYFAEVSYRRDGSSKFSEETRWGNFFSVGGSWVVSREKFISETKWLEWLSYLKFRASYGELGNNRGIGLFPYLNVYSTGISNMSNPGVLQAGVNDPNISWEKTASSNIGVDFSLWGSILNGTVDWYSRESIDLLFNRPLAPSTGYSGITENVGAIKNYGVEVSLNSLNIKNDKWEWRTGINFSFDRNKITKLTQESLNLGNKRWEAGRSMYEFYMPEFVGVDIMSGDAEWNRDIVNSQGEVVRTIPTQIYSRASRYYTGKNSIPDVLGGFNTYLKYKQIDMNMVLNFSFGAYIYDSIYSSLMSSLDQPGVAVHKDMENRWQEPGDVTNVPKLISDQRDYNSMSTRFLFKNDYIRLKALNIGYRFDKSFTEKLNIDQLRLFFQGDNLLTYQSHKGIDPEQSLSGGTNYRSYNQRVISLGLNIKF